MPHSIPNSLQQSPNIIDHSRLYDCRHAVIVSITFILNRALLHSMRRATLQRQQQDMCLVLKVCDATAWDRVAALKQGAAAIRGATCSTPTLWWCTGLGLPCMTPQGARMTAPPNTWPMHWCPMHTPSSGRCGPSSRIISSDIPLSSGRPAAWPRLPFRCQHTLEDHSGRC